MNHKHHGDANVTFLSQKFLHERLEHFQILNSKELHFRGYSLPKDVSRIVPSVNGQLLNRFEDFFGDIIAWKGYSFGSPPRGSEYGVWKRLPKKVLTDIKVFVPPNHFSGTLEWYNLNYNIAIVSIDKVFRAIRREDIFAKEQESSGKGIAIGRDPEYGLLMASFGEVQCRTQGCQT
ncbi:hypothetical protein PR202_gb09723 [Eleusine coracana subsp. coracana]|uniref:Uncharacterized protein n=1 Tax=Eleusine coracana subsp. coracana TaxID=191504 RepID=A0AAV5EGB2_ELECO|nr:hypothetical protein PR202_gb09723 [Eleusine coracana subsp. coracana]